MSYFETAAGRLFTVSLGCDVLDCKTEADVMLSDRRACQTALLALGWRVARCHHLCPAHARARGRGKKLRFKK